jgi:preprotein translocase subunit SecF
VSNLALALNVTLTFGALGLLGGTLTLPGLAGIILGLGIAVDANILINERIREETKKGASAAKALDLGFRRAYASIVDANVTTLLATALLFFFGAGPVRGFAITMMLGIALSMFTAVAVVRVVMLDATKTVGFFALTGLDFNLTAIAALLTIIGYSVNDKVVVYDRMRENMRLHKAMPLRGIIDLSINQERPTMSPGSHASCGSSCSARSGRAPSAAARRPSQSARWRLWWSSRRSMSRRSCRLRSSRRRWFSSPVPSMPRKASGQWTAAFSS